MKSERSLCHLLRVVNVYEKGSGAKLNTTKSQAMWLGRWRTNGASPFSLTWVFKMKILGVYFSNGLVSVEADNWKSKLDKLQNVVNLWKQRVLSLLGRAMIINALGTSLFWHTAKIIILPQWVVDSYDKIVWSFMWPGKTENVSRQRCCAGLRGGGLNVVDFRAKCAALCLFNFSSLRDDYGSRKWHFPARYFLRNRLQKLDMRFSFLSNLVPVSSTPSHFYRSCIYLFQQIFDKHGALPNVFSVKIFIYFRLFFPLPHLGPLQLVFGDPLLVAPSTGGLRCGVNLAERLLRIKRQSDLVVNLLCCSGSIYTKVLGCYRLRQMCFMFSP